MLKQAVEDANLLDGDLVMTVGDLVQGYNGRREWLAEMKEYRDVMAGLRMPWFPVAGNHDVYWRGSPAPAGEHESDYEEHFGPLWYWFRHKNAAFVVLYSDEDEPETGRKGYGAPGLDRFGDEQLAWLEKTLGETKDADHVFVFLHHPRWIADYYRESNWDAVHELLVGAGNVTAVFAGHIHRIRSDGVRDGIRYLTLATTGGGIPMEEPGTGWLHHLNVVTVRKDRISVVTLPVGAVMDPREMTPERLRDIDLARSLPVRFPGEPLLLGADGAAAGERTILIENPTTRPIEVTIEAGESARGWRFRPDHVHARVAPGASAEAVLGIVREADGFAGEYAPPALSVSVDYLAEDRRVTLPASPRTVPIVPGDPGAGAAPDGIDRALLLDGRAGALRVDSARLALPDGPLTIEAWFLADATNGPRALVGKTEQSEFALLLEDGRPAFLLHLGEDYTRVRAPAGVRAARGKWHHLAGVFDGAEARLYLDGKRVGRTKAAGPRTRNALPLFVGAEPDRHGEPNLPFAGRIDDVRISTVARYAGEAFAPARSFAPDADAALLLDMDSRVGPILPDRSPRGAHALALAPVRLAPPETE